VLQILGIAVAALVVIILVIAATKPARFRLHRSTVIDVPPEQIFPHLVDFRKWRAWSPWEELDPNLKRTYEGADVGKGAVYSWDGNKKAGSGRMAITDATAPERLTITLDFTRPFEAHNISEFELKRRGQATEVEWALHGPQPFMFRVMTVFVSMDKLVGKDFERGLAGLKAVAEGRTPAAQPTSR
jgi:uncharacterized protein YndB with AHSA1/START domain